MDVHTVATLLFVLLVVALVFGPWLLGTANRLDRLHVRTDAAWAGLDATLARRAVVTRAVAATGSVPPACAGGRPVLCEPRAAAAKSSSRPARSAHRIC